MPVHALTETEPLTTHAVVFDRPGPAEVLTWQTTTLAMPGPRDVIIEVRAAGVNNADLLQRRGHYPVPPDAPRTLGLECAGRIVWVGPDVEPSRRIGDAVCALLEGGGYAEHVVVPDTQIMPVPRGLSFVQAAALPEAVCTVYANLVMTAAVRPGSSLLVHGGGSGIGTTVIQWAKAVGARVLTTAGSAEKMQRAADLGADVSINYRTDNFVDRVLDATSGEGVDVILDIVGAPYLQANLSCLGSNGHLVIIGGRMDDSARLDLGQLMEKGAHVSATLLRPRSRRDKAAIVRRVVDHVWPLIDDDLIEPVVDSVFRVSEASLAHERLESGKTFGKVVLEVSNDR